MLSCLSNHFTEHRLFKGFYVQKSGRKSQTLCSFQKGVENPSGVYSAIYIYRKNKLLKGAGPRSYKTVFMFNLTKHEISLGHKNKNTNNSNIFFFFFFFFFFLLSSAEHERIKKKLSVF